MRSWSLESCNTFSRRRVSATHHVPNAHFALAAGADGRKGLVRLQKSSGDNGLFLETPSSQYERRLKAGERWTYQPPLSILCSGSPSEAAPL